MKKLAQIADLEVFRATLKKAVDPNKMTVRICMTGCRAYGAMEVKEALKEEIRARGLDRKVEIRETGCQGFCARAPVMVIDPLDIFYQEVNPADITEIVLGTILKGEIVGHLLYTDPKSGVKILYSSKIPFYQGQTRNVLDNCGKIDPKDINHYIINNGYAALGKVLSQMTPDQVIQEVERSQLRGRGGAGFPTGTKWKFCRASKGEPRYIICNADEGDPGAFMDRAVLEGDPHSVIEGMIIAAYSIGARYGYIYVREEYPIAVEHLNIALSQAHELGLLGGNILGSGFSFDIMLKMGAGAFVCGEETALMASIEGKRGMPRSRPPFPAQAGLDGKPTNINNVETFANIRSIILKGADWYAAMGTEESKGTKVFSLAGKVNNTGLVEVPMGVSIRKVLFDIGGGIPKGRKFKAVQMGGPSGGCVPERYLDLPIEYGSLQAIGAIMGSGGMVVMDENNCMVEIARYFLSFTQSESCGKCSPCRLGTKQMLDILTRITQGNGKEGDIDLLLKIGSVVKESSLCGLGQTCPKPVLSTIRYFRDEYEAHIKEKRCPAAACEALVISTCHHTCPVGTMVPKYVALVAEGKYEEAVELVRERNPFPAICGRICHHPCEIRCRRGDLDEPVAIRSIKRFAADWYFDHVFEPPKPFPKTKKEKVAVVGAGPTGLTCAYYLARVGYPVTVFEALPFGGGMLMVGVPEFRLPKKVVQKEIEYIEKRGVEIRYSTPINVNFTIDNLFKDGFKAVFIAAGAQKSQKVGVPGEDERLEGFYYGLSFLRDVKLGKEVKVGRKVAVIGGGNVAIDAARSSLRLGAKKVSILYRRTRDEMLASDEEIEAALDEGISIQYLIAPSEVISEAGKVVGLNCVTMQLGEPDESGRRRPIPIPGTEGIFETDTLIMAVGQAPDLSFLPPDSNLERTRWEMLAVNSNTLATNVPGVFAGGDFVTGPGNIIEAIAAGRRGAVAIDKYLLDDTSKVELYDPKEPIPEESVEAKLEGVEEEKPRVKMPVVPPEERVIDFREIELGFTEEKAREEAKRCLRCDLER